MTWILQMSVLICKSATVPLYSRYVLANMNSFQMNFLSQWELELPQVKLKSSKEYLYYQVNFEVKFVIF